MYSGYGRREMVGRVRRVGFGCMLAPLESQHDVSRVATTSLTRAVY
jgi:hypothetical protein